MAVITEFSLYGRQKKKFSDLAENGTNRLDDIKSGPNLVSDQKVDFWKIESAGPAVPNVPFHPGTLIY